jgi:hypothetical protein
MVMCVTGEENIALVGHAFRFVDDGIEEDWRALTLADVLLRTSRAGGFCFEVFTGGGTSPLAVALIAADPDSVAKIGLVFDLPK